MYILITVSLFEPKKGHLQLFTMGLLAFPTLEGRNMSLKKLSMILCLFMNTSRIVCTFQYQKGHKMYTASNWRKRHTDYRTDSTTVMAFCQKLSCKSKKNTVRTKIFHGWRLENMGPEISNFSHTIPNYYLHFVQIIARKSMTGRDGRLP